MTKYLKQFELTVQYEEYINSDIAVLPNVSVTNDDNKVHYNPIPNYLKFTAEKDNSTISLTSKTSPDIKYSLNGGAWTQWDYSAITLNTGDTVRMKGNNSSGFSTSSSNYNKFKMTGKISASGNIMSLLYDDNFERKLTIPCNYCYFRMFDRCTSLTTAPELPATKLVNSCYYQMFQNCTNLTTAPKLPARTLADYCYADMFWDCTSLTTAPELPATTLANRCYKNMFKGCTSLTTAPNLPATTLADSCYNYMFYGCTSLITAPDLPVTTLANYCYSYMFYGCTSLTTAPELPATTLADSCYASMFQNCTSLTTAPELPATTLAQSCYRDMFYGCTKLNSITCLATNISATNCTYNWVNGVASSGTFTKSKSMTSWKNGSSGIPSGWTVKDNQEIQHLRMWVDDFATDIDYAEGSRTAKMQLEINNPESEGANPYIYSGDTITYDGNTYYLWRADKGYENDITLTRYFATSTVDFDELYAQSLEDNINNTFTSAIGMFDDNKEIYTAQGLIYDGTDAHYLVKIEKI